jgi:hypothetical protein
VETRVVAYTEKGLLFDLDLTQLAKSSVNADLQKAARKSRIFGPRQAGGKNAGID